MTKTRLGALRCPVTVRVGSGAKVAFGGVAGVSWFDQHGQPIGVNGTAVSVVRTDLIPLPTAYNTTGVSAPPERSP